MQRKKNLDDGGDKEDEGTEMKREGVGEHLLDLSIALVLCQSPLTHWYVFPLT